MTGTSLAVIQAGLMIVKNVNTKANETKIEQGKTTGTTGDLNSQKARKTCATLSVSTD